MLVSTLRTTAQAMSNFVTNLTGSGNEGLGVWAANGRAAKERAEKIPINTRNACRVIGASNSGKIKDLTHPKIVASAQNQVNFWSVCGVRPLVAASLKTRPPFRVPPLGGLRDKLTGSWPPKGGTLNLGSAPKDFKYPWQGLGQGAALHRRRRK